MALTDNGNDFAKPLVNSMVYEEMPSEKLKVASNSVKTLASEFGEKSEKTKETVKKRAIDNINNCDNNCKFYMTCSHVNAQ